MVEGSVQFVFLLRGRMVLLKLVQLVRYLTGFKNVLEAWDWICQHDLFQFH